MLYKHNQNCCFLICVPLLDYQACFLWNPRSWERQSPNKFSIFLKMSLMVVEGSQYGTSNPQHPLYNARSIWSWSGYIFFFNIIEKMVMGNLNLRVKRMPKNLLKRRQRRFLVEHHDRRRMVWCDLNGHRHLFILPSVLIQNSTWCTFD